MMKKSWCAIALWGMLPLAAWADGLQQLEQFLRTVQAGQAQFTQTVTAPAKAGETGRSTVSHGDFAFQRPGQFKFVYTQPFAQTIVADGIHVWLYDEDLEQVTQRKQAEALGSTPAALLASASDVAQLERSFVLKALPEAEGLQWVQALPKVADSQIQSVRIGFQGGSLAAMEILDSFGQRSMMRFDELQTLPALPVGYFTFQVPEGADLMQQ